MMSGDFTFAQPRMGGGSLFAGSDLVYHQDLTQNHAAFDDILIQFISSSQFATNQCIVEVWHELIEVMTELIMETV